MKAITVEPKGRWANEHKRAAAAILDKQTFYRDVAATSEGIKPIDLVPNLSSCRRPRSCWAPVSGSGSLEKSPQGSASFAASAAAEFAVPVAGRGPWSPRPGKTPHR